MGLKILGALGNMFKAADANAAEKIEEANLTDFAKLDLEKMRTELQKVTRNLGEIKGRLMTMKDDIADKKKESKDRMAKAEQLLASEAKNAEELAQAQCAKSESLDAEIEALTTALKQQEQLYTTQEANKNQLKETIRDCESQLNIMKTMEDVTKSNEALSAVNMDGAKSASAKFAERQKKMQNRLNVSAALAEETKDGDATLDDATNAALGNVKGASKLAALKAKAGK